MTDETEILEGEVVEESTELEPAEANEVGNPITGEIIDLRAATPELLGKTLEQARDVEAALKGFKKAISVEIHRRLDKRGNWTLAAQTVRLKGQGPLTPDYEPKLARAILEELLEAGEIDEETLERCAPAKPTEYAAKKNELTKLRRANEAADVMLADAEKPVDQTSRKVSIEEIPERFRELEGSADA